MTLRLKSAIGSLAAAFLLGNVAFGDDVLRPIQAQADLPSVERTEDPKVQQELDSREAETEDEDENAPKAYLTDLLIGKNLAEKTGLFINGYLVQSATANAWSPSSRINGPVTLNDRSNDYLMNQLYFSGGRNVDTEAEFLSIGGRVDYVYGTDAIFTQAFGLESAGGQGNIANVPTALGRSWDGQNPLYRQALPQAYGEIYAPILKGMTVKIGHFYTIIGYEVVTTPDNFFTTLPYTFQYGEPFTHTGAMATQKLSDKLAVHGCVIRGWDNWVDNNTAKSFMGGVTWTPGDNTNVTMNMITGPEQDRFGGNFFSGIRVPGQNISVNRSMYALVIQQKLSDKLKYVFQHDHGFQDPSAANPGGGNAQWYGINQYLFYDVSSKLAVGVRAEWFRDDDGVRVGQMRYMSFLGPQAYQAPFAGPPNITIPYGNGQAGASYYAITLGANYKLNNNWTIRPDMRYDWQDADGGYSQTPAPGQTVAAFKDNTRTQQFMASINLITRF